MTIFMDKDFQDRSVFHLITLHEFQQLFESDSIAQLLDKLWQGELTYECDGRAAHYSKLRVLSTAAVKKLPGETIEIRNILQWDREYETGEFFTD